METLTLEQALAKLQQQAEKIDELTEEVETLNRLSNKQSEIYHSQRTKITELEKQLADMNRDCISLFLHEQRMMQLETRLKEAESVIKNWIDWEEIQIKKEGGYVGKEINELISAGRQYMEKVK
jgi:hypothetical protein